MGYTAVQSMYSMKHERGLYSLSKRGKFYYETIVNFYSAFE